MGGSLANLNQKEAKVEMTMNWPEAAVAIAIVAAILIYNVAKLFH